MEYLHHATFGMSVLGVLVIIFGVLGGVVRFLHSEVSAVRGSNVEGARRKLRQVLGYYVLLGLEFLIAADIVDTLMKPTTEDLVILGAIVAIRTVISYSLNFELLHETPTPVDPPKAPPHPVPTAVELRSADFSPPPHATGNSAGWALTTAQCSGTGRSESMISRSPGASARSWSCSLV